MLIDANGKKQGIMQIEKALDKANKDNLDLVQVSPNDSDPIVCKLLDYGKYIFDKKKNISNSKSKVKKTSLKEIKFRPSTDTGDYLSLIHI